MAWFRVLATLLVDREADGSSVVWAVITAALGEKRDLGQDNTRWEVSEEPVELWRHGKMAKYTERSQFMAARESAEAADGVGAEKCLDYNVEDVIVDILG